MNTVSPRVSRPHSGFTLIELLTVIAIIGILAAITIPVVGGVRNSAKKTKTKVQFTQWSAGIRLFKNDYGYYPQFDKAAVIADRHKVNGGLGYGDNNGDFDDEDYLFRELMSGKGAKPKPGGGFDFYSDEGVTGKIQNKKRREFITFDISEITSTTGGDAGDTDVKVDGAVKDAFGNVEMVVIVDKNGDGFINQDDLASGVSPNFPEITAKGNKGTLQATTIKKRVEDSGPSGVRAEVIFYSPGKGNNGDIGDGDAVWSW